MMQDATETTTLTTATTATTAAAEASAQLGWQTNRPNQTRTRIEVHIVQWKNANNDSLDWAENLFVFCSK